MTLETGEPRDDDKALEHFVTIRDGLLERRPEGSWRASGRTAAEMLTASLDSSLAGLLGRAGAGHSVALVALGGYGRGELCLASDVDLLIVYDGAIPTSLAKEVLHPLWDAKLRVGHAVRNERDVLNAARDSVESLTSMVDGRFVAGDAGLWQAAQGLLDRVVRKKGQQVVSSLIDDEAALRDAQPYHLLKPDLKAGRGGLRTLQRMRWIGRIGGEAGEPSAAAQDAESVLLAARNGVHAWAGRADDQFHPDGARGAARWLGMPEPELRNEVLAALRIVEIEFDQAASGTSGRSRRRLRQTVKRDGVLAPLEEALSGGVPTAPKAGAIPTRSDKPWDASDRATLLKWARSGTVGRRLSDQLWRSGWLEHEMPELARTVAMAEPAPFHTHPVDTHLWRTVDELLILTGPDSPEPWCGEMAADLGSLDELILACLFHDVGKGTGLDHSVVGASMARGFLSRISWPRAAADAIARAIELHLLLPQVATQRDLRDTAVIDSVAEQVGDPQLVRALALLTAADSRATGPSTWSPWKARLVRSLTNQTLAVLEGGEAKDMDLEGMAVSLAGSFGHEQVAAHVESMGIGYLNRFDPAEIERHIRVVTPTLEVGEQRIDVTDEGGISSCVVAASDQPGFLVAVSGVFAMHGIEVLDARLGATSSGVVVDTFHVEDGRQGGPVPPTVWPKVERSLGEVLAGDTDLESELASRRHSYRHRYGVAIEPQVRTNTDGAMPSIEVTASDRIGLLHDIAKVIFDSGHDVALAKIDTRGGIATDVFYLDEDPDPIRLNRTVAAVDGVLRTTSSP